MFILKLLSSRGTTAGLLVILLVTLVGSKDAAVNAKLQTGKTVEKLAYGNEPIEIVEVKLSGKRIKLGESVTEAEDWLQGLSLVFKNRTDKPIVFAEIAFDFPETKDSGPTMSYRIQLGQDAFTKNPVRAPLSVSPGASLNIEVAGEYEKLKAFLAQRHQISSINKATIRISFIEFADGTAWGAGEMLRPDPNNPKRYIPISKQ